MTRHEIPICSHCGSLVYAVQLSIARQGALFTEMEHLTALWADRLGAWTRPVAPADLRFFGDGRATKIQLMQLRITQVFCVACRGRVAEAPIEVEFWRNETHDHWLHVYPSKEARMEALL